MIEEEELYSLAEITLRSGLPRETVALYLNLKLFDHSAKANSSPKRYSVSVVFDLLEIDRVLSASQESGHSLREALETLHEAESILCEITEDPD